MTVADAIRIMTDEQLAQFLNAIIDERDKIMSEKLEEQGIHNSLVQFPALSYVHQLQFLKRPAEEVFEMEVFESDPDDTDSGVLDIEQIEVE